MKQARILKIVVASPGDVQAERDMIPAIVDELNKGIADERGVRLEVYRWETDAYPAFHPKGPQGQIDSCLRIEDCDLLVGIFWKRFGTPVHDAQSGTEHEIRLALESCEKLGRPQLMIYFNQAPHESQSPAEKEQWQQVLNFKQTLSRKVLWWEYNGKDQFRDFVRQHLTKFIRGDYSGRPLDELLQAYRDHLTRRVSTVRIFGDAEPKPLGKVFVELTLTEEYERPTTNAQWLGLMDAELRRRRDIFARDDEDREIGKPEKDRKKEKRTLKPDELLRHKTRAVIVGAPGCGKTTLLRYLALKTLQAGKRFPMFLELKSLSEKAFEAAEGNLVELLFAKAVEALLGLSAPEAERYKAFFLSRLKAGEVTIFLDGLDEVAGAKFFTALCRSVNDFMASAYRHNDLIISTRPYALQQRFEGMQEMEIAALNPRQIEAFLQHYYGDDLATKKLQQELRRRRELREMARVPFLLSVIAYLYRQQGEIVGERLELYRQLMQQLITQLDREKNVERFYLPDPDGSLKRDFLKQLAYERLFVDEVDKDAERLILTGEVIAAKARAFCQTHLTTNPHLLAADLKATPLLREIGADAYAFSHLTLQEYLAAVALAEQPDCEKIFYRAYFNPTLAEMEVLPMALGLVRKPDDFYAALERLPESLNFTNLRLQARGLAYIEKIAQEYFKKLTDRLDEFIINDDTEQGPYRDAVFLSFARVSGQSVELIVDHVVFFLQNEDWSVRERAARLLGRIGSELAVGALLSALTDENGYVYQSTTEALGRIGDERVVEPLLAAWEDEYEFPYKEDDDSVVAGSAAEAIGKIGGERAMEILLAALNHEEEVVRGDATWALGYIGGEQALDALLIALKDEWSDVRGDAATALGYIGGERAMEALLVALKDEDEFVRGDAAEALGEISDERAVDALLAVLKDQKEDGFLMRGNAAVALGHISGERAVEALLTALKDNDKSVRSFAVVAIGHIGDERAVEALLTALKDNDKSVRSDAAVALGHTGDERAIEALLVALKDEDRNRRGSAAKALGEIGSKRAVEALLTALKDNHKFVRWDAAEALGKIADERGENALLTAVKDEDSWVRIHAAKALGKIGGERVVEVLLITLKDKDNIVGWYTSDALGKIGDEALAYGLVQSLFNRDSFVRQKAAQAVGYYTSDKQVYKILNRLAKTDRSKKVRTAAREAAEKYSNKLQYMPE